MELAEFAKKMRTAAQLEERARAEADRLMSVAFETGWTDKEIAIATGLTFDCVRMRRRRRKQRRSETRKRPAIPARSR